jgi:hypothetical protein
MNLDQMASRLRRAITPPATAPASAPSTDPAPRAAVQSPPAPGSPNPPPGGGHPAPPAGASSPGERPKRRRWRPAGAPANSRAELAEPPTLHPCFACGQVHQTFPMPSSRGLAAYGESLLDVLTRPEPLGRQARDPWHDRP